MNILVIIPARGGSKGIPRKNLRSLNGKPLISYTIRAALASTFKPDVYVSSEDEEILGIAKKCGAAVHRRPPELSGDHTTLDPVIHDAYRSIQQKTREAYDFVITIQPTSPMLQTATLDKALRRMRDNPAIETIVSAKREAHLSWRRAGEGYAPNYTERLNRQFLEPLFVETGAFVISRSAVLERDQKRFGRVVDVQVVPEQEAIDIDTPTDWSVCEYLLRRKTVLFVVTGHKDVGLGHIYRSLVLANSILNHRLIFLVDRDSRLGYDKIKEHNYDVHVQGQADLIDEVGALQPDVVINDILDTSKDYVLRLKTLGKTVINFEDLGEGARYADLVINALYPDVGTNGHHYFGHRYFCPRDEFLLSAVKDIKPAVSRVLITMGGIDPCNLTHKVLQAIYPHCRQRKIAIEIALGLGYQHAGALEPLPGVKILENVKSMSDLMLKADIIFTSAGRTVYEAACIGTPAIILAQNERELTHFYASPQHGFVNLGLGHKIQPADVLAAFHKLADDFEQRKRAGELMRADDIRRGRERVISLIQQTIETKA